MAKFHIALIIMINYLLYLLTFKTHLFDYIVRDILWFELFEMGVCEKMLNVIKSIYSNLKSKVKFNNRVSSDYTCCLESDRGRAYLSCSF